MPLNPQVSTIGMSRIAGISFAVAGILYLVNLAFLASLGPLPSGGLAFLTFLHSHIATGELTTVDFFVVDALLIIGFTGLFYSFASRNASILLAAVLGIVALTVDEVNNVVFYAYFNISNLFAAATSDQQRLAYGAVSDFANSIVIGIGETFFFVLFSLVVITISVSGAGLLSKPIRYLGVVSGILGVVAGFSGFFPLIILWPVWFLAVAYRLLRVPAT